MRASLFFLSFLMTIVLFSPATASDLNIERGDDTDTDTSIVRFIYSTPGNTCAAAPTNLINVIPISGSHIHTTNTSFVAHGENVLKLNTPERDPDNLSVEFHRSAPQDRSDKKNSSPHKKKSKKRKHKEGTTDWRWGDCQAYDCFCVSCCLKAGCCNWAKCSGDIKTPVLPLCFGKEGKCRQSSWQCISSSSHRTAQFACSSCCCMSKDFPCCCGPCSKGKPICKTWSDCSFNRDGRFWLIAYGFSVFFTCDWAEDCCST